MKKINIYLLSLFFFLITSSTTYSQISGNSSALINASDLESYITFLASPLLKGRLNGSEGLEIAAAYLASQAKLLGLKPANGDSYFQSYNTIKKSVNKEKTNIKVITNNKDTLTIQKPFFSIVPTGPSDLSIEGEVVFAGYGIRSEKYKYDDLDSLKTEGKILLIMDRAPMSDDGKKCLFEEPTWTGSLNFQMKLATLIYSKAKAILIVSDPKSGFSSFAESTPSLASYLESATRLKGSEENVNPFMAVLPKVLFIDRSVADAILQGTGHTLEELQIKIDASLKSNSFDIDHITLIINAITTEEEQVLNNVTAYIEGSDPVLKNEVIVYSSHYDHIGMTEEKVNTGADDDASGCAALLSIAEAFQALKKKPSRSVLFLWVSGEEIGLYGSKSYVDHPLFPLKNTVIDLNMDMIGRVKSVADSTDETPMTGPNSVYVITAGQSSELSSIADKIDKKSPLDFDYSLSGKDHPQQLFSRSDHFSFIENDIPVLFFTTGIHTDYHTPGDVVSKIDFEKMVLITRTMYEIGLTVANQKSRIIVDNPYSKWGK